LGPVQTLSAAGGDADHPPQIGMDASEKTIIVWGRQDGTTPDCCRRIQLRVRSATGALSPLQVLSAGGQNATSPQISVAPNGYAVIVWSRFDASGPGCCERIQVRTRSPAGTLGPIRTISSLNAGEHSDDPEVAMDPSGNAVFVWERFIPTSPGCCRVIDTRALSATGTLSAVQTLSVPSVNAGDVRLGMDANGNAVFAWLRSDQTAPGCCNRVQARARSAAGTLSPVQTLSGAGQNAADSEVGVDAAGKAIIVWTRANGASQGCCDFVQYRTRSAAGVLGTVQTISAGGQNARASFVAVDDSGNAVFAWARDDGAAPPTCCSRIQARSRSSGGVLGPTETLSAGGQDAARPAVSLDPNGGSNPATPEGFIMWTRIDGSVPGNPPCCKRVQAAVQVAP
jgi:hypothetical protein